jgi:hypothetical protein
METGQTRPGVTISRNRLSVATPTIILRIESQAGATGIKIDIRGDSLNDARFIFDKHRFESL